ncbi:hypothetical protein AVEN_26386-1 [Araneus ventricosus]|uniref:Retrovirus-related Pol polyprotein from type-2 retrotransposable element R2DM n=1 Tax=Araneus ventricosus TaxID=182803 RepID=A0A4Y2UW38_ARAVE|nr:hypothetical protein AVEN_26386-1 [Araneus ventricosus]
MLDKVYNDMAKIGLSLNPNKSHSFCLSGQTPVGVRETLFCLGPDTILPIVESEYHRFLGKPVGFNPVPDYKKFNDIIECAEKIMKSLLAPWQRLDALVTFIFPALQFLMRTAQFKKEDWDVFDEAIRKLIKETLYLPDNACNELLYGHRKSGCFGVPIAAEESDLNRINSAFKLLISPDELVAELALKDLQNTVSKRVRRKNVTDDLSNYMSGDLEMDEGRPASNHVSNTWTVARSASSRQKVIWSFSDGLPQLHFKELVIKSSSRRKVLFTIRNRLRQDRALVLLSKPHQGKVMECVAQSPASAHFFYNGDFTRFSDWRFIFKARLGLLPLNGAPWKEGDKSCRRCT